MGTGGASRACAACRRAGSARRAAKLTDSRCLTLFHAHRGKLAFIALSEIRSLEGSARTEHIAARDRQQALLSGIIDEGVAAGIFDAPHPRETSRAITTMCTGVAQWYRIDGELTPEELADRYGRLCRLTAGAAAGR
ncbi:MAG: hypothetical protein U1D68_10150 [Arthrobacter sp.]|nr:hypothetical protein [Arthrobacter sp.]MDZ4351968.1 hypothetical protein [Arthrobacter sp.]